MPSINIKVDHKIGLDKAQERLKSYLPKLQDKYRQEISDLKISWNGSNADFQFRAVNMQFNGKLSVLNDSISISGSIPFALIMFKGFVEKVIKEHAAEVLQ